MSNTRRRLALQADFENLRDRASLSLCSPPLFLLVLFLHGCAGSETPPPEVVPMTGKVTLDGEPLEGATVRYVPTDESGHFAVGFTNASGEYELKLSATEDATGAVPGNYNVAITCFVDAEGNPEDPSVPSEVPGMQVVPLNYTNPETSKLEATVPPGGGSKDFDLVSQ